jgi:hypothetical protein
MVLKDLVDAAEQPRRSKYIKVSKMGLNLMNASIGFNAEGEKISKKQWLKEKCIEVLFGWECSPCWYKFAHYVEIFIMDAFVDLFITLCILINTLFMAIDRPGLDAETMAVLSYGNYVSLRQATSILR